MAALIAAFAASCTPENPAAPRSATDIPAALVDPVNTTDPSQALLITEVGSAYYGDSLTWIEVYNKAAYTVKLSGYRFSCSSRKTNDGTFGYAVTYELPPLQVPPGTYLLLRARPYIDFSNSGSAVYLTLNSNLSGSSVQYTPRFGAGGNGYAEILYNGKTVDYVAFGSETRQPATGSFTGVAPAVVASNTNGYGFSIGRSGALADHDIGADWVYSAVATPGGPNDVTDATDADGDGIPDVCELPGTTFAGMPLYDWGARQGRKDIFIHVDYMSATDPGIRPCLDALNRVRDLFRARNADIHFDVGPLFTATAGVDTNLSKLSDHSHLVPFNKAIAFGEAGSGAANLYTYKYAYMPLARRNIFHYMIMAHSQNLDGSPGSSGRAEIMGNDLMITMGNWYGANPGPSSNYISNWQAATVMHELGHNLGLRHGGFEDNNYKPNYFSVMNYLYQLNGLAVIGAGSEGDRYYFEYGMKGINAYSLLSNGPNRPLAAFAFDYSSGTGINIVESAINEALGLGRGGSAWVDYNNNSANDGALSLNINSAWSTTTGETLKDWDDWNNLFLTFQRTWYGDLGATAATPGYFAYPIMQNDAQELSPPCPSARLDLLPR
jgi:hypothetical protein